VVSPPYIKECEVDMKATVMGVSVDIMDADGKRVKQELDKISIPQVTLETLQLDLKNLSDALVVKCLNQSLCITWRAHFKSAYTSALEGTKKTIGVSPEEAIAVARLAMIGYEGDSAPRMTRSVASIEADIAKLQAVLAKRRPLERAVEAALAKPMAWASAVVAEAERATAKRAAKEEAEEAVDAEEAEEAKWAAEDETSNS
jgi:hypothetical protein